MNDKLIERNYPAKLVDEQIKKAAKKDRKSLIFQQRKPKDRKDDKIRLIFTNNKSNPPLHQWLRECRPALARNEKAKAMGERLQITTKQPKNLQQLVGGKRGGGGVNVSPDPPGCFKCKGCKVSCPILNVTNQFQSTNTQRKYPIKQRLDCTSDWLIYLVTCKKCKGQYVGKSKTVFKLRHSNHKREVKNEIGGLGHQYGV